MEPFELDAFTADRLLSGQVAADDAPPGYEFLAEAVQRAAASGPMGDPAREAATVAAVVDVLRSDRSHHDRGRRKPRAASLIGAKVAIAAAIVLGAATAAAATNRLPDPAQRLISAAGSHLGISVPEPNSHANPHAIAARGRPEGAGSPTGPATSAQLYGLCTAYGAGATTNNPHATVSTSVPFAALRAAADSAGMTVADYCKTVPPPGSQGNGGGPGSTTPPASEPHGPPVSQPHGPPASQPHGPPASQPHGKKPPASKQQSGKPPVGHRPRELG